MRDLIVALSIAPDCEGAKTAREEFNAMPRGVGQVYLEPVDEVRLAGVGLSVLFGGMPKGEGERVASAARRNFGRRLLACSFLPDPAERKAALAWVLEHNRENGDLRCQAFLDAVNTMDGELKTAGGDARAVFAVHNRHAPVLAPEAAYWRMRCALMVAIGQKVAAQAAIDVAEALDPKADWLEGARAEAEKL